MINRKADILLNQWGAGDFIDMHFANLGTSKNIIHYPKSLERWKIYELEPSNY